MHQHGLFLLACKIVTNNLGIKIVTNNLGIKQQKVARNNSLLDSILASSTYLKSIQAL